MVRRNAWYLKWVSQEDFGHGGDVPADVEIFKIHAVQRFRFGTHHFAHHGRQQPVFAFKETEEGNFVLARFFGDFARGGDHAAGAKTFRERLRSGVLTWQSWLLYDSFTG